MAHNSNAKEIRDEAITILAICASNTLRIHQTATAIGAWGAATDLAWKAYLSVRYMPESEEYWENIYAEAEARLQTGEI